MLSFRESINRERVTGSDEFLGNSRLFFPGGVKNPEKNRENSIDNLCPSVYSPSIIAAMFHHQ